MALKLALIALSALSLAGTALATPSATYETSYGHGYGYSEYSPNENKGYGDDHRKGYDGGYGYGHKGYDDGYGKRYGYGYSSFAPASYGYENKGYGLARPSHMEELTLDFTPSSPPPTRPSYDKGYDSYGKSYDSYGDSYSKYYDSYGKGYDSYGKGSDSYGKGYGYGESYHKGYGGKSGLKRDDTGKKETQA
ncbi:hypothetical protein BDK51DRAFT_34911 [Blyttiomyces helicus]|uniref:Uncharacterized protein n=1 Tax=Blyttiomyces helicus TaxID=388810 RepID=A0A4P9WA67_9FUNG|nr:hypothetical protein BDK51DRAFT_34911 [Blyttiomyces helicus]|eukprot:RKO89102.1 hypothetical protein BDK51DRAFT_34911 [Blyttiomyces helicus]